MARVLLLTALSMLVLLGRPTTGAAQGVEDATGLTAPREPVPSSVSAPRSPRNATSLAEEARRAAPRETARPASPTEPQELAPSSFHAGADVVWQRAQLRFITPMEHAVAGCGCGMADRSVDLLRGSLSVGWRGLSLEGSIARAIQTPDPFTQWTVGVRLDTSYAAALSLALRFAYLRRTGSLQGEGGRAAAALQIRLIRQIVFYAEGGIDVTNAPQNTETILSYALFYSAGVRVVLARR